jgi:WD40 repeat protein
MIIGSFFGRISHPPLPRIAILLIIMLTCSISNFYGEIHDATEAGDPAKLLKFYKKIGIGGEKGWRGWMSFVAFSPDGKMVASDGPKSPNDSSGGLSLWSFPDGQLIKTFAPHPQDISKDWKYYSSDQGVIDLQNGKPLPLLNEKHKDWAVSAFSQDSAYVAAVSTKRQAKYKIRIIRISDGSILNEFGKRAVFSLAFNPQGTILASGHWDNVTLWNIQTGERMALLRGFGRYVVGISFNSNGALLAAGTDLGGLQIWDVSTQTRLHSVDLEGGDVSRPVFSPDGQLIAAGVYGSGTVSIVDVRTGKILDRARVSDMGCGSAAFSPDGRYLITPSTGGLITRPPDKGGTIRVFEVLLQIAPHR